MEKPAQFCENCGSPLGEGDSFCEACGAPAKSTPDAYQAPQAQPAPARPQPPPMPPGPPPAARRPVTPPPAAPLPAAPVGGYPPPPPPPPAYYQPPPPPPGYYPPRQPPPAPRRGPSTGLIVGGGILALVVCCGLALLVISLAGGASFLSQVPSLSQNPPPAVVIENTQPAVDIPAPVLQDTDEPDLAAEPTLTSQPAPNEPQATPALPAPQGQRMEFTDDLSTNDNGWHINGGDTPPRQGYLISAYYIETTKIMGEYQSFMPRINAYTVSDFEIEFYGLLFSGDGYLGLDFHFVDDQNYYQAAVKDGKFLIRKKINGQFINLTQGPWIRSNSIWETGPNKIKVICHGDVIALEINDGLMAQLRDNSLPGGSVALTAGVLPEAPDGTTAEARFNGFHVVWWK